MKYSKEKTQLVQLVRTTSTTIRVEEAASILGVSKANASKILSHYAKNGWLMRIARGVYVPVPLSSLPPVVAEDPFVIAHKLFSPCYIGGWTAASHWGLTEQIFRPVIVITQTLQRNYKPEIAGIQFILHLMKPSRFYGLATVWSTDAKIQMSDPTRTIVDLMLNPALGGGLQSCLDIYLEYMNSEHKATEKLIEYLRQLKVGAVYKRLGFLTEKYLPDEKNLIETCRANFTTGNAKLDMSRDCTKLVTKWNLLVPENWK